MDMVVLRIEKSIVNKVILIFPCMRIKRCLTLDLKERTMSIPNLLALGVVLNMRVRVWPVGMVIWVW